MLTHVSTEGLLWVATHVAEQGKEMITPVLNFDVVGWVGKKIKATVHAIPVGADFAFEYNKMYDRINTNTGIVTFCTPNNPTGKLADSRKLNDFINSIPQHVIVLVDDAYIHYQVERW